MKLKPRKVCEPDSGSEYWERGVYWGFGSSGVNVLEVVAACPSLSDILLLFFPTQLDPIVLSLVSRRVLECTTDAVHKRLTAVVEATSLHPRVRPFADKHVDALAKDGCQGVDFGLDEVCPDSLNSGSRAERLWKSDGWSLGSMPFNQHDGDN